MVTGAAGFIGSAMVGFLNEKGFRNLFLVDDFSHPEKEANLSNKKYLSRIEREDLFNWLKAENPSIDFVFHFGARTDTTEFDYSVLEHLNLEYSKSMWRYCTEKKVPLIYASSAATYGDGAKGYSDEHSQVSELLPINPYARSKHEFDLWALAQNNKPPFWAGLKFFNVYGPNEYHKGRMASVIFHAFQQVKKSGIVKLFRSHRDGFNDGEQKRDFIYVKDVLEVSFWLMNARPEPGIYNLGTGRAETFIELVESTFEALGLPARIEFIDMPEDIRDGYQYFTEADTKKLHAAGYPGTFNKLRNGVSDYVKNYLVTRSHY